VRRTGTGDLRRVAKLIWAAGAVMVLLGLPLFIERSEGGRVDQVGVHGGGSGVLPPDVSSTTFMGQPSGKDVGSQGGGQSRGSTTGGGSRTTVSRGGDDHGSHPYVGRGNGARRTDRDHSAVEPDHRAVDADDGTTSHDGAAAHDHDDRAAHHDHHDDRTTALTG
jgi:hypothetical protein